MFNADFPYENVATNVMFENPHRLVTEEDMISDDEVLLVIANTVIRNTEPRTCIVPRIEKAFKANDIPEDDEARIDLILKLATSEEAAAFFDVDKGDEAFSSWHSALKSEI